MYLTICHKQRKKYNTQREFSVSFHIDRTILHGMSDCSKLWDEYKVNANNILLEQNFLKIHHSEQITRYNSSYFYDEGS